MKLGLASLAFVALTLAVAPAVAQTVYDNGPTNGHTDAWLINFGFIVSDTFNVPNNDTSITGATFAMWIINLSDTVTSAELSITSGENGGTSYFDQTVTFTQSDCMGTYHNGFFCIENTTFNGPTLNSGTYWLNLQNAIVPSGDTVGWDENSGPSSASSNIYGSIPSESFTVLGTSGSTVPEPSGLVLFASGFSCAAVVLRRKLF